MSNPEKANEGVAELSGNAYYPPPPPNPPPAQTQTQQGDQYQQQQHQPQQQFQTQQTDHQPQQQFHPEQQFPPEKQQQQQQFPPPPAQQPPQQQQPYFPPPPTQTDEKQSHQQQQSTYTIPAYNPANPVFAPPPSGSDSTAQGQTGHVPVESYNQQPQQPTQQQQQQFQQPQQSQQQHQQPTQPDQHGQKKGGWGDRFKHFVSAGAAAPINSLAHKLGSQSFLPETLDKECDKAAAILKSFCTKGVYADPGAGQPPTSTDPKAKESTGGLIDPTKEKPKNRVIVTIPPKVISKAVGLAIFTTLRAGFQVSGATGSGILIARLPDGSWSPPSGIQVHSLGGGFQIGLDIYDCVCVINSKEALAAFMNTRVSLGSDLAVVAGPYGAGGAVDFGTSVQRGRDEADKKATGSSNVPGDAQQPPVAAPQQGQPSNTLKPEGGDAKRRSLSASTFKPVFSYVKSRGFYAGIQVDGTVVVERKDANALFYGTPVTVQQILQGQVPPQGPQYMWPVGSRGLMETLKGAEAGGLGDHPPTSGAGVASGNIPPTNAPPVNTAPVNAPPVNNAPAQTSSGAPPAYVDDGSHANVGDVKYS